MWDSGRTRVARPLRYGSAPCAGRGWPRRLSSSQGRRRRRCGRLGRRGLARRGLEQPCVHLAPLPRAGTRPADPADRVRSRGVAWDPAVRVRRRARSGTWAEIRVPVAPPVGGRARRPRRRARADRRRATRVRVAPAAMGRGAAGRPGSSPTSEPTLDAWCFRRCSRGAARSPWSASCWPPTASP